MNNADRAILIFYNHKRRNRVFEILGKKPPCPANERSVYELLIILHECRGWLDHDRSIFSVRHYASVDWHWHTVVFFHLLWDAPARARFFYANCNPFFYLMKIDWPSRNIESFMMGFLERKLFSSLIIPFIPRVFPHLDQFVTWRS